MSAHWLHVLAAWGCGAALLGGMSLGALLRHRAARRAVPARRAGRGGAGGLR